MADEAAVLRVIEVHAGDTTMYVYAEGVHVDSSADDGADIGPKGMAALIEAWRKLHPDELADRKRT